MSAPDVTVVVPTHNRSRLVQSTLRSILSQRDVDLEVVVVDDGSSDDTPAVLHSIDDQRLRVVRNDPPRRLPGARNRGLDEARGRWVAFCDDDDLWAPDKLRSQLAALRARPAARWALSGEVAFSMRKGVARIAYVKSPPDPATLAEACLVGNPVPGGGSATLLETALVRDVGAFRQLPAAEDWDLWARVAQVAPAVAVDEPLVGYRLQIGSHSHDDARLVAGQRAVLEATAARRHTLGLQADDRAMLSHRARQAARSNNRRAAIRLHAACWARSRGDLLGPFELVGVALAPRWLEFARSVWTGARLPSGQVAEVASWLGPLLGAERVVAGLRTVPTSADATANRAAVTSPLGNAGVWSPDPLT